MWKRITKSTFLRAAVVRAVRTVAQTAVSLIGVSTFLSDVNWIQIASASVLSGIVSVLTSIATGLPEAGAGKEAEDDN